MKIDIDSYLYIILMVIILVVSGLAGRRKKRAQKMRPLPSSAQQGTRESEDIEVARPRNPVIDPFERLEQILTGQSRYESMEGESLETLDDEEEAIVDEEEKILAAQDHRQESMRPDPTAETEDEQGKKSLDDLFGDVDEVTRAIIYSEILPRKYI